MVNLAIAQNSCSNRAAASHSAGPSSEGIDNSNDTTITQNSSSKRATASHSEGYHSEGEGVNSYAQHNLLVLQEVSLLTVFQMVPINIGFCMDPEPSDDRNPVNMLRIGSRVVDPEPSSKKMNSIRVDLSATVWERSGKLNKLARE